MKRRTIGRASLLVGGVLCSALWAAAAAAQAPPPPAEQTDLTKGLLELLNSNEPTKPAAPAQPLTPAAVELDGEDLGEQTSNPLAAVRQSMLIAAGMLQRGTADAQTMQLQTDIVQRLDELIAELEQAQPPASSSDQSQQAAGQSQSEQRGQQQSTSMAQRSASSSQAASQQSQASQTTGTGPGQSGAAGDVNVDLADPKALQQSVWGHLPERMRTQMQSRMVESFLPSYREQIEAYFKALLEQ